MSARGSGLAPRAERPAGEPGKIHPAPTPTQAQVTLEREDHAAVDGKAVTLGDSVVRAGATLEVFELDRRSHPCERGAARVPPRPHRLKGACSGLLART